MKNIILLLFSLVVINTQAITISGTVKDNEDHSIEGVKIKLMGSDTLSLTTDQTGEYTFTVNYGESFILMASKSGYTFTPNQEVIKTITSNQVVNFLGDSNSGLTVSGTVKDSVNNPIEGVTIKLIGTDTLSLTTNHTGDYSFNVNNGESFILTASKSGYTFTPKEKAISTITSNQVVDFLGELNSIKITGYVKNKDDNPIDSVYVLAAVETVPPVQHQTYSDENGYFEFLLNEEQAITITCQKDGYTFEPETKHYDRASEDSITYFVGTNTIKTVNGWIYDTDGNGVSNVGVVYSGTTYTMADDSIMINPDTTYTSGDGSFTIEATENTDLKIKPFKYSYEFDPQFSEFLLTNDTTITYQINLEKPTPVFPVSPNNNNLFTTIGFVWQHTLPQDEVLFELEVKKGDEIIFSEKNLSDKHKTIEGLDKNSTFQWRVKAHTSNSESFWTDWITFTTDNREVNLQIEESKPEVELGDKKPLLLIHDWNQSGFQSPPLNNDVWKNVTWMVENDETLSQLYKVYFVKYYSNLTSVKELAKELRNQIENNGLHEQKIVIIGHGLGGLIGRSYMCENIFTQGMFKGNRCGDLVSTLITLGTPNYGTPLANKTARDSMLSNPDKVTSEFYDSNYFKDLAPSFVNRNNALWDNHDNLFNLSEIPEEENIWLKQLNNETTYNHKIIAYGSTRDFHGSVPIQQGVYSVGAYLLNLFSMESDGVVPISSALMSNHTINKTRLLDGLDHEEIIDGNNKAIFRDSLKVDLENYAPLILTYPTDSNLVFKGGSEITVTWSAPEDVQKVDLLFSDDNGATYSEIANQLDATDERYVWKVPQLINTTEGIIKVKNSINNNEYNTSKDVFTIYNDSIYFASPVRDTLYSIEYPMKIKWKHVGLGKKGTLKFHDLTRTKTYTISENVNIADSTYIWDIPSEVKNAKQALVSFEITDLDEQFGDEEEYIFYSDTIALLGVSEAKITAPDSLVSHFGIRGERLHIDSTYTIKWETEGYVNWVKLSLCQNDSTPISEIAELEHVPGFSAKGSYRWTVPEIYNDSLHIKIEAGPKPDSIVCSGFTHHPFRINREPDLIEPMDNDSNVAVYPCFEFRKVADVKKYNVSITDSESNKFDSTYHFNGEKFCLAKIFKNELQVNTNYEIIAQGFVDENTPTYKSKRNFKVGKFAPLDFNVNEPVDGFTYYTDAVNFNWDHSVDADYYKIRVYYKGELVNSEIDVSRSDTTFAFNLGEYAQYSDTLFYEVDAINDFGTVTQKGYFFKKSRLIKVGNYIIIADNWKTINPGLMQSDGTFSIQLNKEQEGEHRLPVYVKNGRIEINTNDNTIEQGAYGDIYFNRVDMDPEPVKSCAFELEDNKLYFKYNPGEKLLIRNSLIPELSLENIQPRYIDLGNYILYLDYDSVTRQVADYPGVKTKGDNSLSFTVTDMQLDAFGGIEGNANDIILDMGLEQFSLKKNKILKYNNEQLYFLSKKTKMSVIKNDYFSCGSVGSYGAPFAFLLNGDSIGYVGFENEKPSWDLVVAFPDIKISKTSMVAPYANFKYFDSEKKWGLDMQAMLKLPWVDDENMLIKGAGELAWLGTPIPKIEGVLQYVNAPPYLKRIKFELGNMGKNFLKMGVGSGMGVGEPPLWQLLGFSGEYTANADPSGVFKNFTADADVSIGFGPQIKTFHMLSVTGGAEFLYQKRPHLEETFTVSGDLKAFQFLNLANAEISISSMQKSDFRDFLLSGNGGIKFPSQSDPIINGGIDFKFQVYSKPPDWLDINTDGQFTGKLQIKLSKGRVKYSGVSWPSKDMTFVNKRIKFGKIKHTGGKYGFIYNTSFNIRYPCGLECDGITDCHTKYCSFDKDVGCFIPVDGSSPKFQFNHFTRVKFNREKSDRFLKAGMVVDGIKSYHATESRDSVVVNIPTSSTEFVDFAINYTGEVRPIVLFRNPDGEYIPSDIYLELNPEQEGNDGFLLTLPFIPGDWSFIVPNANEVEDYTIKVLGSEPLGYLSYKKVEINQQKLNIECSYSDAENDSVQVKFYYAETDSTMGTLLSVEPSMFSGGTLGKEFDITNIKPGKYYIYAIANDGVNGPIEYRYNTPIVINNDFVPNTPEAFEVLRLEKSYLINWNVSEGANRYKVKIGNSSNNYADTVFVNSASCTLPVDSLDKYIQVHAISVGGNESEPSSELHITYLDYLNVDTIAPNTPGGLQAIVNTNGDEKGMYVLCSWNEVSDAKGYYLNIRRKNDSVYTSIDVKDQHEVKFYKLDVGETYWVSVVAYDKSLNLSENSEEVNFDFFDLADVDGDGINDDMEIAYFGSIEVYNDPNADPDNDGLSIATEINMGTNPNNYDTDGDHVWDDVDKHPLSAHDYDNDLMADDWEDFYNVELPDADTDQDSLSNQEEYRYGCDPRNSDTDGGGMIDGEEIQLGLNPNDKKDDVETENRIITDILEHSIEHYGDTVKINWITENEDLLKAFNVYRRYSSEEAWMQVNEAAINRPDDGLDSHTYSFNNSVIDSSAVVYYLIEAVSEGGSSEYVLELTAAFVPVGIHVPKIDEQVQLYNYPNPFNENTLISFYLPEKLNTSNLSLFIFNQLGEIVYTKKLIKEANGFYKVRWNRTNQNGVKVDNGIYLYQIKNEKIVKSNKMIVQ